MRCGGVEVNRAQVERGMAWVYPQYNKDASLPAVEQRARANKSGLWADAKPLAPWAFRRAEKNPAADAGGNTTESTCYTGPRGGQYHLVDGKKSYGC